MKELVHESAETHDVLAPRKKERTHIRIRFVSVRDIGVTGKAKERNRNDLLVDSWNN